MPDEFVKGYFNEFSFYSEEGTIEIQLTHPEATETYIWSYDEEWSGSLEYLDEKNTTYLDNWWTVTFAILEDEPTGEWNLEIFKDDERSQFVINVVQPSTSFSASGDLNFYLEPYREDTFSDEQTITFTNTGNVRMRVDVVYDDENLIHEVPQDIFEPGESGQITFQYHSSTSGLIQFGETISIQPYPIGRLDLDIDGNIGVGSRASYGLTFGVTVGYQGYNRIQTDNFELQYLESMEVRGNSHNNLTFYVYPHDDIDFDVDGSDVEIIEISEDPDRPLSPDEGEEIELVVHFRSHHENDGYVELELDGSRYTTNIQLSETVPQPGDEEVSFLEEEAETITLGIVLIAGVAAFGVVRVLLSKSKDKE